METCKVRSGGLNIQTCKVNRACDWTQSKASFVIGHVISMLTTQASNQGFIWNANLFSKQTLVMTHNFRPSTGGRRDRD